MTKYTHKKDKNLDGWMFHEDYFTEESRFLPKSIQVELAKRLTDCARNPIAKDDLKNKDPRIEVKLKSICDAYRNKQERSRIASAKKRQPKNEAAAAEESESESESEAAFEKAGQNGAVGGQDPQNPHAGFHNFISEFRTRMRIHNR